MFCQIKFVGLRRLFVLVYPNQSDDSKRIETRKYYLPVGIIKNYSIIINKKTFMTNPLILIQTDMKKSGN